MLLFSGGEGSIVLLRLAEKAFRLGRLPFPVMHVDTGHAVGGPVQPLPARARTRTWCATGTADASCTGAVESAAATVDEASPR